MRRTTTLNKIAALLMSVLMLFGSMPAGVFAQSEGAGDESTAVTAEVMLIGQACGGFMAAPAKVEVSSEISDDYGYTDSIATKDGVSALDALIKLHCLIFGDGFTKADKDTYLAVGDNGFVTTIFGEETGNNGFFLNDGYPNNDGTATKVSNQVIKTGDKLNFFIYGDTSSWSDTYTWIDGALTAAPGEKTTVTVSGSNAMMSYQYTTPEAFKASASALEGVELKWVDANGALSDDAIATTDADGKADITVPSDMVAGTYYLTASGDESKYILLNPASFTVGSTAPAVTAVSGIEADTSISVKVGKTASVSYKVLPENATDKTVVWESGNTELATVSDGIVTGVKAGTTSVTVKTNDGNFTATCNVEVKENTPAKPDEISDAIAKRLFKDGISSDDNMPWFAADLAAYRKMFADNGSLTDDETQNIIDKLIDVVDKEDATASALSKAIIALRALGYDPTVLVKSNFEKINAVEKLLALINADDNSGVTNVYTLPYVIIALQQDEEYATDEVINKLILSAKEQKALWQSLEWGPDAAAPMVLALAPYAESDAALKSILNETVDLIKQAYIQNGSLNSWGEASSTGLVIAAFSAMGTDSAEIKSGEKSLIDHLMLQANEAENGFVPADNSFGTEQGFRGLVAWQLYKQNKGRVYDFSANPKNAAQATWWSGCPVEFQVIPAGAEITVEGATAKSDGKYDLQSGEYAYTVKKDGYSAKSGTITVSAGDVENHTKKIVKISLAGSPSSGASGITVNIKVMSHKKSACNGSYTYKNNSSAYTAVAEGVLRMSSGQTVFDALHELLTSNNISYDEGSYGYISAIGKDEELDHGDNSGWMFKVNGIVPESGCRDVKLTQNCTVVWFYTDDYTSEYGSEKWHGSSAGGVSKPKNDNSTDNTDAAKDNKTEDEVNNAEKSAEVTFSDVKDADWFYDAVRFVSVENDFMKGTELGFEPELNITRAMLVTILYRMYGGTIQDGGAGKSFADVSDGEWYSDAVSWAAANDIANGVSETEFAPDAEITREDLLTFLYRCAVLVGLDTDTATAIAVIGYNDADDISDYAKQAFYWCLAVGLAKGKTENTLNPTDTATRAETAMFIMRLCSL